MRNTCVYDVPENEKICPVCGMNDIDDELWRSYRGIKYKFCSQQCLDRFVAHTGLYSGTPQTGKSEKQKGRVEIKCHKVIFTKAITKDQVEKISNALKSVMGIKRFHVGFKSFSVTYDLVEVSLVEIEHEVEKELGEIHSPLFENIKRGWIHYTEECELENLAHPPKRNSCH